jgi:hypothetical protein
MGHFDRIGITPVACAGIGIPGASDNRPKIRVVPMGQSFAAKGHRGGKNQVLGEYTGRDGGAIAVPNGHIAATGLTRGAPYSASHPVHRPTQGNSMRHCKSPPKTNVSQQKTVYRHSLDSPEKEPNNTRRFGLTANNFKVI